MAACACPFHGWLFDTPAEPLGSTPCTRIYQRSYPVETRVGIVFAYLGEGAAPPFDGLAAPATHVFAFRGLIACNWLQALEVGIDPAHTSLQHRYPATALSWPAAPGPRPSRGSSAYPFRWRPRATITLP